MVTGVAVARNWGVSNLDDYDVVRAQTTSDFRDFWWTARHLRQTGEITSEFGVHNYLPFFTVFMLPWSFLPLPLAAGLFTLLSLGLFAIAVALTEELLHERLKPTPRAGLILALVLALPYVHACAVVGNVGLLLAFLMVAAWFLMERGHDGRAGMLLGLAAAIKLLPGLLIVYFVLKRRWRTAGAAVGSFVVLGLGVPLASVGLPRTTALLNDFYDGAVRDHSAYVTLAAEEPRKTLYSNNALPMVLRRLLSPTNSGKGDEALYVNVAEASPATRLALYALIMSGLALITVWSTLRGPQHWPPTVPAEGRRLRGQYGAWCCLMLLASPLVWTHYLPLVYWALALAVTNVGGARRRWGGLVFAALWLVAAGLLSWPTARAAGAQIWGVLLLWAFMVTEAGRCDRGRTSTEAADAAGGAA